MVETTLETNDDGKYIVKLDLEKIGRVLMSLRLLSQQGDVVSC